MKRRRTTKYSREDLEDFLDDADDSDVEENKASKKPKRKKLVENDGDYVLVQEDSFALLPKSPSKPDSLNGKIKVCSSNLDLEVGNCRFCNETLKIRNAADHVKQKHEDMKEEYFKCPICGEMAMAVGRHVRKYHHPQRFRCDVCGEPYVTKSWLARHRKLTHFPDELDFVCDGESGCGKRFMQEAQLKTHRNTNHGQRQSKICDVCGAVYRSRPRLLRHLANVHGIGERKYQCPHCDKDFADSTGMKNHLLCHNPKRTHDHKCNVCDKAFYTKHLLNQHKVCHRPPSHECKICGKMFLYRAAGLGTHLKQVHKVDMQGNPLVFVEGT